MYLKSSLLFIKREGIIKCIVTETIRYLPHLKQEGLEILCTVPYYLAVQRKLIVITFMDKENEISKYV